jgi:hypothetical protein
MMNNSEGSWDLRVMCDECLRYWFESCRRNQPVEIYNLDADQKSRMYGIAIAKDEDFGLLAVKFTGYGQDFSTTLFWQKNWMLPAGDWSGSNDGVRRSAMMNFSPRWITVVESNFWRGKHNVRRRKSQRRRNGLSTRLWRDGKHGPSAGADRA